jgi:competence protein ComEA
MELVQHIIKDRNKGKFNSFEDFQRVEGIGEQTAKKVKNDVKSSKEKKVTQTTVKNNTKKKS